MTQEVLDALQGAAAELPAPETEDGGRAMGAADAETADSAAQTALDDGGRRGDIRAHFDALAAQAEQLRAEFPEFDLRPGELPAAEDADPGTGLVPLGDMVLSMERVAAQAKEFGHSRRRELAYLVTHSVLHLLGYDHLDEGAMKKQMREREEAIMALLGLER